MTDSVTAATDPVVVDEKPTTTPTATQVANPNRTLLRSVVQFLIALATLTPYIAPFVQDNMSGTTVAAAAGQALVVYGFIVRLFALPSVEAFLQRFAPALAALKLGA